MEEKEDEAEIDDSQDESTSLEAVPREKLVWHTSWTSGRKERGTFLKEAMPFTLAPLRNCSDIRFESTLT